MLPEEKYKELKEELDNCNNPLFMYDDDPDGLCSFLILYRYKKEGNGVFVKSVPVLDERFLRHVEKYNPDKIFVLDVPNIDESFFEDIKIPIIWVDHHPHSHPPHIKSFNPCDFDYEKNDSSTTALCYNTIKNDLWIAAVGAIGDWTMPPYIADFQKEYPDLLDKKITSPPEALFDSRLSKVIDIFSMVLKGDTHSVKKRIKALIKIKNPYDLLDEQSEEAKYIVRKMKPIVEEYEKLIAIGKKIVDKEIIVYIYESDKFSFSKEISNYLQYKNPDKIILVGRNKSGEYKLSLRSQHIPIPKILEKSLIGLEGYGGGHEHACGACVKEEHFVQFLEKLKQGFSEAKKDL